MSAATRTSTRGSKRGPSTGKPGYNRYIRYSSYPEGTLNFTMDIIDILDILGTLDRIGTLDIAATQKVHWILQWI